MRALRLMSVLLCWGVVALASTRPEDAVVVRNVRYAVEKGTGILLVGTDGTPTVVSGERDNLVTLGFHHATVSSPPGAAHLYFREGPVRSAVIERSGTDSITVFVRLRAKGSVDVGLQGHDVVLRVIPVSQGWSAAAPSVKRSGPISAEIAAQFAAKSSAVVSSPALQAQAIATPAGGSAFSRMPPSGIIALVLFAFLTSAGTAYVIVRRGEQKSVRVVPRGLCEMAVTPEPGEPLPDERVEEPHPALAEEEEESDEEREDRAYQLARAMRRGKGEMDLALRLEKGQDEVLGATIAKNCPASATKAQRVRNAKRLGVGRGEFDLALRLKTMVPEKLMEENRD